VSRRPGPSSFDAVFVVKDGSGQKVAYVYYEEEPGRRSAAKLLTKDEALRIAANIAKLPELGHGPEIGPKTGPLSIAKAATMAKPRRQPAPAKQTDFAERPRSGQ